MKWTFGSIYSSVLFSHHFWVKSTGFEYEYRRSESKKSMKIKKNLKYTKSKGDYRTESVEWTSEMKSCLQSYFVSDPLRG